MHLFPFKLHAPPQFPVRKIVPKCVPYIIALLVLALPSPFETELHNQSVQLMSTEISISNRGPWRLADLSKLLLPDNSGWLRIIFNVPHEVADQNVPLGLYLGGTFSASAIWNGVSVGEKGRPGGSKLFEQPGPIDAVMYLPPESVVSGENLLLLKMSSFYQHANITSIIHRRNTTYELRVAPYSAEQRRPIGYYAAPFLVSGILIVAFFFLSFSPNSNRHLPLFIIGILAISSLAEISRSFVNYGYEYHGFRLWLITVTTITYGLLIFFYVLQRSAIQISLSCKLAFMILLVLGGMLMSTSILSSPPNTIGLATACGACLLIYSGIKKISGSWELCAALVFITVLVVWDFPSYLDRGLYASCLPLIALLVWPTKSKAASNPTITLERLIVRSSGKQKFVPVDQILAIHGSGNYAEIELLGGEKMLDDRTLNQLANEIAGVFCRVHRSHIVNLDHVIALQSLGAGRHRLELQNHAHIPVSRAQITELRRLMKGQRVA